MENKSAENSADFSHEQDLTLPSENENEVQSKKPLDKNKKEKINNKTSTKKQASGKIKQKEDFLKENKLGDDKKDDTIASQKQSETNIEPSSKNTEEEIPQVELQTNTVEKETIEEIGISEEIINEKMKNVYELKNPKKKKKSTIINILMLAINLVLMAFIVKGLFSNLEDTNIVNIFNQQGNKMWWLVGGLIMYVIFILIQVLMYRVLIKNLSGRKSWKIAYDAAIVGKYYDNITPFAVGGQAMQILRLTENGIGAGVSTSIPILKMMINSGVNALLALVFFIFGLPFIPKTSILNDFLILLLEVVGVIGLIVTVIMAMFIFLISSGTIVTRTLISGILRLGYKMKLIKDYRTTYKKVMNQVAEYKFSMGYLWKHKKILLQLVLYSILECISYGSLVFFVAMAFTNQIDTNIYMFFFMCLVKYYLCSMASCYIPLPGGTGLMEVSFILLFGMSLGNNMGWALLAWRFLTYYIIIIHGFGHELRKIIMGIIKSKKQKNEVNPKKLKKRKAE